MSLPSVAGWLIDFRTARSIFASGNNARIAHCVGLCGAGNLHICHCEEQSFRGYPPLQGPFLDGHNCVWDPDENVFERCAAIASGAGGRHLLTGNEVAVFLTAIGLSQNFGVISDHQSDAFVTVHDLCLTYGVPVFFAEQYFIEAGV
jgi:hypothetical protein